MTVHKAGEDINLGIEDTWLHQPLSCHLFALCCQLWNGVGEQFPPSWNIPSRNEWWGSRDLASQQTSPVGEKLNLTRFPWALPQGWGSNEHSPGKETDLLKCREEILRLELSISHAKSFRGVASISYYTMLRWAFLVIQLHLSNFCSCK